MSFGKERKSGKRKRGKCERKRKRNKMYRIGWAWSDKKAKLQEEAEKKNEEFSEKDMAKNM